MHKPKQIEINIPKPCNQPWEEMTPCGQGRFCNHCQKTVIDFTSWSDRALYEFFSKKAEGVCGRFLSTQTNRPIHIPPQPHSRLYRMTVTLGLTLMFTQATDVVAQNKPPLSTDQVAIKTEEDQNRKNTSDGELFGNVLDERKEPLLSAVVQVFQDGVLKGGTVTDFDGMYSVKPLEDGEYDIVVSYIGYDTITVTRVPVHLKYRTTLNFTMRRNSNRIEHAPVTMGFKKPLLDDKSSREQGHAPVLGEPSTMQDNKPSRKSKKHSKK